MTNPYLFVLIAVCAISPFAISIAQKQDKKTKSHLKNIFLFLLISQIILSLLNRTVLPFFLVISLIQVVLLFFAQTPTVILNLANTFYFFLTMAQLERGQNNLSPNPLAIAIAFILLFNNVMGLLLINKEKRLVIKSYSRRTKFIFLSALILVTTLILGFSYQNQENRARAITKITALPEVVEYLKEVPFGIIAIDHEDKNANAYIIHVYEVVDNHTATFNWYTVNKTSGAITKDF